MVKISKRLEMVASLVSDGSVLADVGTDHGYVPIYLLEQQRIPRAIAMDIGRGPLARAEEHIALYGAQKYIETRLSDGVAALTPGEVDSIVIAGMGGGLVIHILESGADVCRKARELVLQPQSELAKVREYLQCAGYVTEAEEMLSEDGKYYPMMRVHYESAAVGNFMQDGENKNAEKADDIEVCYRYGRLLLEQQHPVLYEYLQKERDIQEQILSNLKRQEPTEQIEARICEVEENLKRNGEAFAYYKTKS